MLCTVCTDVLTQRARQITVRVYEGHDPASASRVFSHHVDLDSLRAAVEQTSCRLCSAFWNRLSPENHAKLAAADQLASQSDRTSREAQPLLTLSIQLRDGSWRLDFDAPSVTTAPSETLESDSLASFYIQGQEAFGQVPIRTLPTKTSAFPVSKPQVIRWLKTCRDKHARCNESEDRRGWNPTRLLDVGSSGDQTIRLIDDTTTLPELSYFTLSHRWGDGQFMKLHPTTIALMRNGIRLSDLPHTFQDAVEVTRSLDTRYLWIDSLCIVQDHDDLSDWARESSRMHQVYSHAACNISATGANNPTDGLFFERRAGIGPIADVEFIPPDNSNQATMHDRYIIHEENFWDLYVVTAPLNTRGWVLQERLLAKRVLHFGRQQILWECHELDAAETFPEGLSLVSREGFIAGFKNLDPSSELPFLYGSLPSSLFGNILWGRIVTLYSRCLLTKPEDKLIAIAGIARRMRSIIHDDYYAGMWRRTLVSELFWKNNFPYKSFARPTQYRAPTWSWASVEGPVLAGFATTGNLTMTIVDVCLDYVTEDRMGLLCGGILQLEGVLRRITIHRRHLNPDDYRSDWYACLAGISMENNKSDEMIVYIDVWPEDFEQQNAEKKLYAMVGHANPDVQRQSGMVNMLLLESQNDDLGTFTRIGVLESHSTKYRESLLARDDGEEAFPCVKWDAEKRLHTIRVI